MALLNREDLQKIDTIIENLRMQTGLSFPEDNLVELAKSLGVEVYESKFNKYENVDGFLEYPKKETDRPKIFLNKDRSSQRKKFTLAHELGHYVLHKKSERKYRVDPFNYTDNDEATKEETEANYFAAALLVPEDKLKSVLALTNGNIEATSEYFGVSKPVIENRIKWLQKNQ